MDAEEAILTRRSIREYTDRPVSPDDVSALLEAARWAPSGLNNQPWRFTVIDEQEQKRQLASHTRYGPIIKSAPCCIIVWLHPDSCYDRTKDLQAIGATIQNILLAAHNRGLGAVWLGEILNDRVKAEAALNNPAGCELMAVVAVGHPRQKPRSTRKPLSELRIDER